MKKLSNILAAALATLAINVFAQYEEVGTLNGQLSVAGNGAAVYTLPIDLPAGRGGMTPQLALQYNSSSESGILGKGWGLAGWSYIARVNETMYYDNVVGALDFVDDGFTLEGSRLILTSQSNNEYRTEVDANARITFIGNKNIKGAGHWKVVTPDGYIKMFGETSRSKQNNGDHTETIRWHLSSVTDLNGNRMEYEYEQRQATGETYLTKIIYSINYASEINGQLYYVVLNYESNYDTKHNITSLYAHGLEKYEYNVTQILTDISVYYNDTFLKKYDISYLEGGIFNSKYIESISLKNSSNLNLLKPTTFEWEFNAGLLEKPEILFQETDRKFDFKQISGDFDGDGISDVAEFGIGEEEGYLLRITLLRQNGNPEIHTYPMNYVEDEITNGIMRVGDVNGDGKDEIFVNYRAGTNFAKIFDISLGEVYFINYLGNLYGNVSYVADFDADGLEDVITGDNWGYENFYGGNIDFNIFKSDANRIPISGFLNFTAIGNFSGNGKAELLYYDLNECVIYELKGFNNNLITCEAVFSFPHRHIPVGINVGDFNGDGKSDLLVRATTANSENQFPLIYFSYGNGFIEKTVPYDHNKPWCEKQFIIADLNNDNLDDIFYFNSGPHENNIAYSILYKNSGLSSGFTGYAGIFTPDVVNYSAYYRGDVLIGDYAGTGENNLLYNICTSEGSQKSTIHIKLCQRKFSNNNNSDKIIKVTNGLSDSKIICYTNYKYDPLYGYKFFPVDYPLSYYRKIFSVVEGLYQSVGETGGGGSITPSELYSFSGLIYHAQGKGLLGFQKTTLAYPKISTIKEASMDIYAENVNDRKLYFNPYQKKVITKSLGKVISEEEYQMSIKKTATGNNLVYTPFVSYSINRTWDNDIENTYKGCMVNIIKPTDVNQYGDVEKSYTFSDENNRDFPSDKWTWKSVGEIKYNYGNWLTGPWYVNMKQTITTTSSDVLEGGLDVKKTEYEYKPDKPWLLKKVITTPNQSKNLALVNEYDYEEAFANLILEKTYPEEDVSKARTILKDYDGKYEGRFLTKETIVAPGDDFITQYSYNEERGLLTGKTDALGNFTTFRYSPTDVQEKTNFPDNTAEVNKLYWSDGMVDAPKNAVYCIFSFTEIGAKEEDSKLDQKWNTVITFYDRQGKELRTVTQNIQGLKSYYDKAYDPYTNRLLYDYKPYYSTESREKFIEYVYDGSGRVSKMIYPEGFEEIYTYKGRLLKVENSQTKIFKETLVNALGKPEKISDPAGNTTFEYDVVGRVIKTESNGAIYETKYDEAGNQKELIDPDAGLITYLNNAFGEVIEKTDNKGNKFVYEFDQLGRPLFVDFNSSNVLKFDYYESFSEKGFGQVKTVFKEDGFISDFTNYVYDDLGRLTIKTEKIGRKTLVTSYAYNSENGMLDLLTYPAGFAVKYKYNSNGHLEQILRASDNKMLWNGTEQNHRGQWVKHNTAVTNSTNFYDRYGFLERTLVENQKILQDFRYQYSPVTGNMISRADLITSNKESFTYDSKLHSRLESCSINGSLFSGVLYYDNGNIRQKSDVSTRSDSYIYNHPLGKLHAVTEIDMPTSDYASSAYDQQLVFDDFSNKVSSITKPYSNNTTLRLSFTYGPDNQLKHTSLKMSNSGPIEERFYAGDYELLENVNINYGTSYNYLYAPTGLFAVVVQEGSDEQIYYLQTDHIGSITGITDNTGLLVQKLSYDPWGRRRNPANWKDYTVAQALFSRGFTGHEHLDLFGLINMNARLYDPFLGRFLSPDNYIQAPDHTQSYNRYSYCLNNPLKYTDPSGDFFVIDDLILGAIGGSVNLLSNLGNVNSIGQGLGYFGIGFVGGALSTYITPIGSAALVGAGNAALGGYIKNGKVDPQAVIKGAITSGVISGLTMGLAKPLGPAVEKAFKGIASPVAKGAITQGVVGSGIGALGGGLGAAMNGDNVLQGIGHGALWGGSVGLATGAYSGYSNAKSNNQNPWTGKTNATETPYRTPYQKGQDGVRKMELEIEAQGGKILAKEVTVELNGVRVRVDIAADFNGEIRLIEVKNGPSAGFTPNQKINYPQMKDGASIIPIGRNASQIPQWQIGQPTNRYILEIHHFYE
ncbi:MAG: RHS repeat-associated core domain-containing [Bacteroidetes bacterium]|nr:MAG: RHS repeat-associated core domain-containing [Bacteroidota bacterium]